MSLPRIVLGGGELPGGMSDGCAAACVFMVSGGGPTQQHTGRSGSSVQGGGLREVCMGPVLEVREVGGGAVGRPVDTNAATQPGQGVLVPGAAAGYISGIVLGTLLGVRRVAAARGGGGGWIRSGSIAVVRPDRGVRGTRKMRAGTRETHRPAETPGVLDRSGE
jgi:hypothetical protein